MESFNQGASSCNIGALGSVLRRLESNLQCTGVDTPAELIQKTTLLVIARGCMSP